MAPSVVFMVGCSSLPPAMPDSAVPPPGAWVVPEPKPPLVDTLGDPDYDIAAHRTTGLAGIDNVMYRMRLSPAAATVP